MPSDSWFEIDARYSKRLRIPEEPSLLPSLAVFFGKALKMAQGVPHTHAAKSDLTLNRLSEWALQITANRELAEAILAANTARHAFDIVAGDYPEVVFYVGRRIVKSAQLFAGAGMRIQSVIFDYDGNVIFDSERTNRP